MPLTRRGSTLIVLAMAAALVILQTIPEDQEPSAPAIPKKTINFFHYFSGTLSGGIDEMVAEVNASSDAFTVLATPLNHEAFKTMIPTSFERGNPPELFSYWAGEKVRQLVADNRLQPIDDLWLDQHLAEKFSPAIVDSAISYDAHKYLLPITQHIVVFFYNKRIFDRLGLLPPTDWQEFKQLCKQLKEQAITPIALGARERWPAQFWFDYLLLRTAGPEYRHLLTQGKQRYLDPEVVTAIRIWVELLEEGYFNSSANQLDWSEATALVRRGDAAMTLMGTWATQTLEAGEDRLEPGKEYDFFAFPVITAGLPHVSVGPIDGIVISRDAENAALAQNVLAYFAGRNAQQRMSVGSGALSPDMTVPDSVYTPLKLRLKQEIDRSDQWAFAFDLATPQAIADRGLDSFSELIAFPGQYIPILEDLQAEITLLQEQDSPR